MSLMVSLPAPKLDARPAPRPRSRRGLEWARIVDIVLTVPILIFVLPLMLLTAIAVFLGDGGPVFYAQRRIGRDGRTFPCLKFRSMAVDADERLAQLLKDDPEARSEWEADHKLRCDPRITRIGGFLRKTSVDELPQLFNVLRGEMSLVGPRPIVEAEVRRYSRRFKSYCSVRPGITGLWQVSGRNDVDYRTRVALDVLYARHKCAFFDVMILVKTIPAVLMRSGSY